MYAVRRVRETCESTSRRSSVPFGSHFTWLLGRLVPEIDDAGRHGFDDRVADGVNRLGERKRDKGLRFTLNGSVPEEFVEG